ncbi:rod shape-determining protein MreD [Shewanella sp.]|uniref:rod shape-determining protein MreD n=1 Tax=Shewanella sp. TaxID=50422 RepID=UPI003A96AC1A
MTLEHAHGRLVVWCSLLIGLLFELMPIPDAVMPFRPDWLLLIMIYWAMALPHRYNILTAFVIGTLLDVLLGAHLGVRSLAYSIVIYLIVMNFQRLRTFPVLQQSVLIGFALCCYHLIVFWVQFLLDRPPFSIELILPAVSGMILWRWIYWMLRRLRRRYKVK